MTSSSTKMQFHYQTIETFDGKIAYVDSGGSGFPVVLIHGNSCSSEVFKKQLAAFGDQYRMIAIDLPGHGRSDDSNHPNSTYSIPGYAKILNEVIGKLGLTQFRVIGFSLGGNIALQWTQLSDGILGIMTISSAPMKYSEEAFIAYPPYEGSYAGYPDLLTESQAIQYMSACGLNTEDIFVRFMINDAMRTDGKARAKMVASVLEGRGVDETTIVKSVDMPLAVVVGSEDSALGIDYLANLSYRNLWRSKIEFLPHAQHAIVLYQADQLHPLIRDFLEDLESISKNKVSLGGS
jgi:pimeloyl-ACP methyl ester carboxylesterase